MSYTNNLLFNGIIHPIQNLFLDLEEHQKKQNEEAIITIEKIYKFVESHQTEVYFFGSALVTFYFSSTLFIISFALTIYSQRKELISALSHKKPSKISKIFNFFPSNKKTSISLTDRKISIICAVSTMVLKTYGSIFTFIFPLIHGRIVAQVVKKQIKA